MSIARAIRRRRARTTGTEWPSRSQPVKVYNSGAYHVLRPTKGWFFVSAARLGAQARLAEMRETIDRRMGRRPMGTAATTHHTARGGAQIVSFHEVSQ